MYFIISHQMVSVLYQDRVVKTHLSSIVAVQNDFSYYRSLRDFKNKINYIHNIYMLMDLIWPSLQQAAPDLSQAETTKERERKKWLAELGKQCACHVVYKKASTCTQLPGNHKQI